MYNVLQIYIDVKRLTGDWSTCTFNAGIKFKQWHVYSERKI